MKEKHRHLFICDVEIDVRHNDREVEFHSFMDYCKLHLGDGVNYGHWSCENIAEFLIKNIEERYPDRNPSVKISEDGECWAVVRVFGSEEALELSVKEELVPVYLPE